GGERAGRASATSRPPHFPDEGFFAGQGGDVGHDVDLIVSVYRPVANDDVRNGGPESLEGLAIVDRALVFVRLPDALQIAREVTHGGGVNLDHRHFDFRFGQLR